LHNIARHCASWRDIARHKNHCWCKRPFHDDEEETIVKIKRAFLPAIR
jgi:hypothetical protein